MPLVVRIVLRFDRLIGHGRKGSCSIHRADRGVDATEIRRAVVTRTMAFKTFTEMAEEERASLGRWRMAGRHNDAA